MKAFEIYWDDLNEEAQERLSELYHENIEITPIAVINIEHEEEPNG